MIQPLVTTEEAEIAIARMSLFHYCVRMVPGFDREARHAAYLCEKLEALERGEITRLIITAPPGHGKSTLLQAWVTWFMGRRERRQVIALSASEKLARRNSRTARSYVQDQLYPWFDVTLNSEAIEEWGLSTGSDFRTFGAESIVVGFRADAIVVDDLQADRLTAEGRENLESWFRRALATRLKPNGVVALIQTRWGVDDLVARLLDGESGSDWLYLNLPAICDNDKDLLGRKVGEALWPREWPVKKLEQKRREVGAREFDSQYQGAPVPDGGLTFKTAWLQQRYREAPAFDRTCTGFDGAWRTAKTNDFSAAVFIGRAGDLFYVDHAWQQRLEYAELRQRLLDYHARMRPDVYAIEDAASGTPLLSDLKESSLNLIPIQAKGDKVSRAEAITPLLEAGKVFFKEGEPWLDELLANLQAFPGGKHDDLTDAFVHALCYLRERPRLQYIGVIGDSIEGVDPPGDSVVAQYPWLKHFQTPYAGGNAAIPLQRRSF